MNAPCGRALAEIAEQMCPDVLRGRCPWRCCYCAGREEHAPGCRVASVYYEERYGPVLPVIREPVRLR